MENQKKSAIKTVLDTTPTAILGIFLTAIFVAAMWALTLFIKEVWPLIVVVLAALIALLFLGFILSFIWVVILGRPREFLREKAIQNIRKNLKETPES